MMMIDTPMTQPAGSVKTDSAKTDSVRKYRNAQARMDALRILKNDHTIIRGYLKEIERLRHVQDWPTHRVLVCRACWELKAHTQLEDEVFYPAIRGITGIAEVLEKAEVEHAWTNVLIDNLLDMDPSDKKYAATISVLSESVRLHMREEELVMLRKLARAQMDWRPILRTMQERRMEIRRTFIDLQRRATYISSATPAAAPDVEFPTAPISLVAATRWPQDMAHKA